MELTRNFKQLNRHDAPIAGGKGASLGEMTQAGIPVPPGFVILSGTFDQFIKDANLIEEIAAALEAVDHREVHTIEMASEKIQGLIKNATMPANIALDIEIQFQAMNTKYVAVRSSATAEDGQDHAWAGQLDSYLNVTEDNVLEKVQHCWASLFTPRAIFYRFEKGLYTTQISVAVVVQKMVNSEISGIAFSVHPVTEDRNQLIIEAGFGLGEAIVSGQVTPDSYVVEKHPRAIIDISANTQNRALYRIEGGGNEWLDIPEPQASSQVLTEVQIQELSDIIIGIENHYGFPCDIEWAFERDKFYVVQSRPITTLTEKEQAPIDDQSADIIKKVQTMKLERWLERPFQAFVFSLFEDATRKEAFEKIGISGVELRGQFVQNNHWYLNNELLEEMDAQLEKYLVDHTMTDITAGLEKYKNESLQTIKDLVKKKMAVTDKWAIVYEILKSACTYIWVAHGVESYYQRILRTEVPKYIKTDIDKFIGDASIPKKKNAHSKMEEMIRAGKPAAAILKKFSWIKCRDGFSDIFSITDIEKMKQEITSDSVQQKVKIPKELKDLFTQVQELVFFRTERTDVFYELLFVARPIINELAREHGLSFNELSYYRSKSLIAGKLEQYRPGLTFVYLDGAVLFQDEPIITDRVVSDEEEIKGIIAYKGKARGLVKIVKEASELDKVTSGDILVTQMTFPSFISAMNRAVAFVTDEGGITCHAAIIAREMKKPCIIGTKIATQVLRDNDLIEVDADQGIVKIIKRNQDHTSKAADATSKKKFLKSDDHENIQENGDVWVENFSATCGYNLISQFLNFGMWKFQKTLFGKNSPLILDECFIDCHGLAVAGYYKEKQLLTMIDELIRLIYDRPDFFMKNHKKSYQLNDQCFVVARRNLKKDLPRASNKQLAKIYFDVLTAYEEAHQHSLGSTWYVDSYGGVFADSLLEKTKNLVLANNSKLNPAEVFTILTTSERTSLGQKEEIESLKILDQIVANKKIKQIFKELQDYSQLPEGVSSTLKKSILNHCDKWCWMPFGYMGPAYGLDYYLAIWSGLVREGIDIKKEIRKNIDRPKEIKKQKAKFIKELKIPKDLQKVYELAADITFLKGYRKDATYFAFFALDKIIQEISSRIGLSVKETHLLLHTEIEELLRNNKKAEQSEIGRREQHAVVIYRNNKIAVLSGVAADQFLQDKIIKKDEVVMDAEIFKGNCASAGKATGIVKIVNQAEEMDKMEVGDIMVAHTTFPALVPAMKKAAAIVTEDGGITCHAAIVARELKVPCVTGVKTITRVVKDGDEVEVDANNGVIRILKKNS